MRASVALYTYTKEQRTGGYKCLALRYGPCSFYKIFFPPAGDIAEKEKVSCGTNLGEDDLANVWTTLNVVYNGEFKNLVNSGTLPNEADVLAT